MTNAVRRRDHMAQAHLAMDKQNKTPNGVGVSVKRTKGITAILGKFSPAVIKSKWQIEELKRS